MANAAFFVLVAMEGVPFMISEKFACASEGVSSFIHVHKCIFSHRSGHPSFSLLLLYLFAALVLRPLAKGRLSVWLIKISSETVPDLRFKRHGM